MNSTQNRKCIRDGLIKDDVDEDGDGDRDAIDVLETGELKFLSISYHF